MWLHHIRTLLSGARRVSGLVEGAGISVLIHCSDGWDRTSQLCSLSKIMLDPYYRTVKVRKEREGVRGSVDGLCMGRKREKEEEEGREGGREVLLSV